jgi:pimeloyl-ACP methyl ester carboxylesterase
MSRLFVNVDDVRLNVATDGAPDATPLALLNGALCNLDSWTPALDTLAKRYFVVRHDGRGNGQSSGGERIAGVLPDAELHVMEMTGHGSVLARPDLFVSLLDRWAAQHI